MAEELNAMLKNISLYQFKNYAEKKTIPFSALNIIYGSNGRGKSTMLQALLLLSQSLRADDKFQALRLNGEFVNLERFDDILNSYAEEDDKTFSIGMQSGEDIIDASFKKGTLPQKAYLDSLMINGNDYMDENEKENDKGSEEFSVGTGFSVKSVSDVAGLQYLKNMCYISADRKGPQNTIKRNDNWGEDNVGVHGENVIQVLYHHPEILKDLNAALSEVFNGAILNTPSDSTSDNLDLLIDSNSKGVGYKPSNVGFGLSHVLPILVQVLLAKHGSLVIVENPEAHLHPGAQSRIMNFLLEQMNKKSLQIFIETHSDHVINGARLAVKQGKISPDGTKILFVAKDPFDCRDIPSIEEIAISRNGALSKYFEDFLDEWTKQSGDLL